MHAAPRERGLDVGELARAAGLSERSLYRAFRAAFGMGPYEYFTLARLRRFRENLLRESRAGPWRGAVTRAAADAGFCHFGRFSQSYRRQFGETPRDTLARWAAPTGAIAAA